MNADEEWFVRAIEGLGAVPAKDSPYKNVWKATGNSTVELVKFFAREFNMIPNGGGWWNHRSRDLTAQFMSYASKPGWIYICCKPRSR